VTLCLALRKLYKESLTLVPQMQMQTVASQVTVPQNGSSEWLRLNPEWLRLNLRASQPLCVRDTLWFRNHSDPRRSAFHASSALRDCSGCQMFWLALSVAPDADMVLSWVVAPQFFV